MPGLLGGFVIRQLARLVGALVNVGLDVLSELPIPSRWVAAPGSLGLRSNEDIDRMEDG